MFIVTVNTERQPGMSMMICHFYGKISPRSWTCDPKSPGQNNQLMYNIGQSGKI